jgi:hypothetical protein
MSKDQLTDDLIEAGFTEDNALLLNGYCVSNDLSVGITYILTANKKIHGEWLIEDLLDMLGYDDINSIKEEGARLVLDYIKDRAEYAAEDATLQTLFEQYPESEPDEELLYGGL